MAIQLTLELPTGVSGDYWRVTSLVLKRTVDTANIVVALYKDQAARNADKDPLLTKSYQVEGATLEALEAAANPVEYSYNQLKELPEFDGYGDI